MAVNVHGNGRWSLLLHGWVAWGVEGGNITGCIEKRQCHTHPLWFWRGRDLVVWFILLFLSIWGARLGDE